MTTTEALALLVTACPDHGVKVAPDRLSAHVYQEAALACWASLEGWGEDAVFHAQDHAEDGLDCWVCCDKMVIDPDCLFCL